MPGCDVCSREFSPAEPQTLQHGLELFQRAHPYSKLRIDKNLSQNYRLGDSKLLDFLARITHSNSISNRQAFKASKWNLKFPSSLSFPSFPRACFWVVKGYLGGAIGPWPVGRGWGSKKSLTPSMIIACDDENLIILISIGGVWLEVNHRRSYLLSPIGSMVLVY